MILTTNPVRLLVAALLALLLPLLSWLVAAGMMMTWPGRCDYARRYITMASHRLVATPGPYYFAALTAQLSSPPVAGTFTSGSCRMATPICALHLPITGGACPGDQLAPNARTYRGIHEASTLPER
jgi:hypothetical protein